MDFLKVILGDDLYAQFEAKINEHNGNEANKTNQIKIGNLGGGEYVSKGKYSTLEAENQTNATKLAEANKLIAQLQKAAKGDEALQGQVTAYQTRVQALETELAQTKLENEMRMGLLAAGAKTDDIDYLMFKLKQQGELALDENGKIKGWDEKLSTIKTQQPKYFDTAGDGGDGYQPVDGSGLPKGNPNATPTKEQFLQMPLDERMQLKKSNENLYRQYANK